MKDYTTKTNLKSIDNIVNYALEKKMSRRRRNGRAE